MRSLNCMALLAMFIVVSGCDQRSRSQATRQFTESYTMRVTAEQSPPRARERTAYRIVVVDRETNQPIEGGEGRIFATSRDGVNVWDGFARGPEVGTYRGYLSFITAGSWAMAIEFRSDSTLPLERVDWLQEVLARPTGSN